MVDRLHRRMDQFSPAERRIARLVLFTGPAAALGSVSTLSARAGVSAPTVSRFAARLGFPDYASFQAALREEVEARIASPQRQYATARSDGEPLDRARDLFLETVGATFADVSAADFSRATELVCDTLHHLVAFGGRFSGTLAAYLVAHLHELRPRARLLDHDPGERAGVVLDTRRGDVAVVFDYRRYQRDVVELAEQLHERGAVIVLFTDRWLSPVARFAEAVLAADVAGPSPFDSLVPAMALVEALVAATVDRLGPDGEDRVRLFGQLADRVVEGPPEQVNR